MSAVLPRGAPASTHAAILAISASLSDGSSLNCWMPTLRSMCHGGSNHINLVNMTGLYMRLTTPLPSTNSHCGGTTLIVGGNLASSFLANVIKGQATCMKGGGTEMIPRMPDDCSTSSSNPRACLTAAEIKLVEDWVTAGAPQ